MGRFLALGVVSSIGIYKKGGFSIKEKKDEIINNLSKYLDMSKYNYDEYENALILRIKPEHFNNNIHSLIKTLYPLIKCKDLLYNSNYEDVDILSEEFNSTNAPLNIKQYEETEEHMHDKGDFYCEWNECKEDIAMEYPKYWVFESRELIENFNINFAYINLWHDWNKIDSEDETNLIEILNTLRYPYYDNELSKNILFYIAG